MSSRPSPDEPADEAPDDAGNLPLREIGEEPDPRFTFANERTFLAWNRTALALIAAGLAAAQLVRLGFDAARYVLGLPLIALGGALALSSYRRWRDSERALRLGEPLPYSRLPRLLGLGVGAVALAAGILAAIELASQ